MSRRTARSEISLQRPKRSADVLLKSPLDDLLARPLSGTAEFFQDLGGQRDEAKTAGGRRKAGDGYCQRSGTLSSRSVLFFGLLAFGLYGSI